MARLPTQQSSIIVNRLLTKENKLPFPFAAHKRKFAVSVFRLQQTNERCRFLFAVLSTGIDTFGTVDVHVHINLKIDMDMYMTYTCSCLYMYIS
jgi:hypothetical protein